MSYLYFKGISITRTLNRNNQILGGSMTCYRDAIFASTLLSPYYTYINAFCNLGSCCKCHIRKTRKFHLYVFSVWRRSNHYTCLCLWFSAVMARAGLEHHDFSVTKQNDLLQSYRDGSLIKDENELK